MEVRQTGIEGLLIIQPNILGDERGYFFESFSQKEFEEKACKTVFVQDNESKSRYGVLRGLHFQMPPFEQAKLVRVVRGRVLDVAVDIRKAPPHLQDISLWNYPKKINCNFLYPWLCTRICGVER